jgi:hypothetical protein
LVKKIHDVLSLIFLKISSILIWPFFRETLVGVPPFIRTSFSYSPKDGDGIITSDFGSTKVSANNFMNSSDPLDGII